VLGSSAGAAAGRGDPEVPKGEGWRWVPGLVNIQKAIENGYL